MSDKNGYFIIRTDYNHITKWASSIAEKIKERAVWLKPTQIIDLVAEDATLCNFLLAIHNSKNIQDIKFDSLMIFAHGEMDKAEIESHKQCNKPLFDNNSIGVLKDMGVFAVTCHRARDLGKDAVNEKNAKYFIGFSDSVIAPTSYPECTEIIEESLIEGALEFLQHPDDPLRAFSKMKQTIDDYELQCIEELEEVENGEYTMDDGEYIMLSSGIGAFNLGATLVTPDKTYYMCDLDGN